MARRKTVVVEISASEMCIQRNGWSNAFFSEEIMKKPRGWVTEWKRGKNFPSPEEAAQMCKVLSVEPEDILVKPEDITLVRSLMDEKKPTQEGELDEKALDMLLERMTIAELQELMGKTAAAMAKRAQNG